MGERLLLRFGADSIKTVVAMATESSHLLLMGKRCISTKAFSFDPIFIKLVGNEDRHKISDKFAFWPDWTTPFGVRCP